MAINPIHLLTASTAKATNGSSKIEVFGSIDTSRLFQGSVVTLGTFAAVEAISGTLVDSSGNSTITLFQPWPEATTTARLSAFNSIEGLTGAIEKSRQVVANTSAIEDLSGTGFLERTGPTTYALNTVTTQAKSFLNDSTASAQRDTLKLGDAEVFPNPLDFGLGISGNTIASLPTTSMDDLTIAGGVFRVINTNTGLRPDGFSQFGVVAVWRYDSNLISQIYIDANGKKASRVIKDTGVGDWDIEFNSGNSVNPLDFGLGVTNDQAVTIGNFNTIAKSGLYGSNSGEEGSPISSGIVSTLVLKEGSQNQTDFLSIRGTSGSDIRAWIRGGKTDTRIFTNWAELYHTENSVNPLDFGIGIEGGVKFNNNSFSDYNEANFSGIAVPSGSTSNAPNNDISSRGTLLIMNEVVSSDAWYGSQLLIERNSFEMYHRVIKDSEFSDWRLSYDSGNSVNPLDFGISPYRNSATSDLKGVNIDTLIAGGLFTGYGANHSTPTLGDNPYQGLNGAFSLINIKGVNADGGKFSSQLACSTSPVVNAKIRASGSGNFGDWVDVFHSGNTNFNEFGGTATNDIIAIGFAQNSSSAKFALSINSVIAPDSVSVLGDFEIVTVAFEAVTGGANVTPQLSSPSSNKVCILDVSNLSGLTKGESLYLRQNANNSKITVNF
jgi:hypothetical protein